MKKKLLAQLLTVAVIGSILSGCGNTAEPASSDNVANEETNAGGTAESAEAECEHEWVDATCTAPKTCSKCGATEGVALGHTWVDATFAEPKTCSVCGETEGTVRQSYFEENGLAVADAPVACTMDAVLINPDNPEEYWKPTDGIWEQLDCYSEPAEEEGYQLIYLELLGTFQVEYDAGQDVNYNHYIYSSAIYDWYTGRKIPQRGTIAIEDTDAYEIAVTLEIDGVSYEVSYSRDRRTEAEGWVFDDNGNATNIVKDYNTYCFKVPDSYDGLVYAALPQREYTGEVDTETVDESVCYAADEDEYVDGTAYFRINKEGMISERTAAE